MISQCLKNPSFVFVSNPVLHHQSGLPVLPTVNEHRSLAKPKQHSCEECGQCFHYMSGLKRHQKIHTGEKPYGCDQCGQHFSEMSTLKKNHREFTRERNPMDVISVGNTSLKRLPLKYTEEFILEKSHTIVSSVGASLGHCLI